MSDFIYSNKQYNSNILKKHIKSIYTNDFPKSYVFHGDWGSLAISNNMYNGFLPYETNEFIAFIISGPVLTFTTNDFLVKEDSNIGTKKVFDRWIENKLIPDKDLDGPFLFGIINKKDHTFTLFTDLMLFIPAYIFQNEDTITVSSHVDILARTTTQTENLDKVSITDFILNSRVTYPYTIYKNIKQLSPGTKFTLTNIKDRNIEENIYWQPKEEYIFANIEEAARKLNISMKKYVENITSFSQESIAQFISAGEDSRAICGLLPKNLNRDAYIFLDSMNKEGRIAQKITTHYNCNFKVNFRSTSYYANIFEEASKLIGIGTQYEHSHSLEFAKSCDLKKYYAIFGGFFADSIIKGEYTKKIKNIIPFYEKQDLISNINVSNFNSMISKEIIETLNKRIDEQYHQLSKLRPNSSSEWFELYPASSRTTISNLNCNRRLFSSYEPFMSNEIIKIASQVPTEWKLNKRLFNLATKDFLKPSKWILHGDGRLPYFSYKINIPLKFINKAVTILLRKLGFIKGNEGPWGDWENVFNSNTWKDEIINQEESFNCIKGEITTHQYKDFLENKELGRNQKVNFLQVLKNIEINRKYNNEE